MIPSSPNWEKTWNSASASGASGGSARTRAASARPICSRRRSSSSGSDRERLEHPQRPPQILNPVDHAHDLRTRSNSSMKSSTPPT